MLKNIWDTVTGNYRFIKYDGSQFHRGKWASIADRPEMKVGLACVAFNCMVVAYGNNDLGHLVSGNLSDISNLTKSTLSKSPTDFILGVLVSSAVIQHLVNLDYPKKDKAIDTYGTTLSRAQLSLKDIEGLKKMRFWGGIYSSINFAGLAIDLMSEQAFLNPALAVMLTGSFMSFDRSAKILNGKYVICDEPPKKTQTQRSQSSVFAGVTSPQ